MAEKFRRYFLFAVFTLVAFGVSSANKTIFADSKGFDGNNWASFSSPGSGVVYYEIGDKGPAGGIVFYVTDSGLSGLEAAPADQSSNAEWGCHTKPITGADGAAVGTGKQNTADILAECSTAGIAASIADDFTLGGYDDWFLPSKDELYLLYQQKDVVGGFTNDTYWSSTEYYSYDAWSQLFKSGLPYYYNKYSLRRVRAVRAF